MEPQKEFFIQDTINILELFINTLIPSTWKSKSWIANANFTDPEVPNPSSYLLDYKMESKKTKGYFNVCIY